MGDVRFEGAVPQPTTWGEVELAQTSRNQLSVAVLDKPLSTTERNTLSRLVIGMAVKGYNHDPAASK
jgi:hypothetical protein